MRRVFSKQDVEIKALDLRFDQCQNQKPAALAVAKKIGHQFPATPEAKLMWSVFERACHDLFTKGHRRGAALFLQGDMPPLQLCGVDPEWARNQLLKAGVSLDAIY